MQKTVFEWDDAKATENLAKHGVSFEAASRVFLDPFAVDASMIATSLVKSGSSSVWSRRVSYSSRSRSELTVSGSFRPAEPSHCSVARIMKRTSKPVEADWSRLDAMTESERSAAALSDRDVQPLTQADMKRMARTPQVKVIRRALALTQEEFSERYSIPLSTLRDWEQGRSIPDQSTRAYLKVIAHDPEGVRAALHSSEKSH